MKVCVLGLGVVGDPTADHIAKRGSSVIGYDLDENKVDKISSYKSVSKWSEVPKCDVYIICVNTGWKDGKPDMSNIFDVCHKISAKHENHLENILIIIESTVSLGTCQELSKILNGAYLVHVPHRYWSGDPKNYGVKQKRVIGGLNDESLEKGLKFYEDLDIPLHVVPSIEIAEIIKITENAYRFVQIAFAEEVKQICDNLDIPFEKVREGANTKWNIELLEARNGIGSHCLPKDIKYLSYLGNASLLKGAIETDEKYKKELARRSQGNN
jgi:nucleotide sugar dehydrogenase